MTTRFGRSARLAMTALALTGALTVTLTGSPTADASPTVEHASPARVVTAPRATVPRVGHVFVIVVENKGFDTLWGNPASAPYLVTKVRKKGVLLTDYYGTAHNSQPNYIAMVSGQAPNPDMQADCQTFDDFVGAGTVPPGQRVGIGCVFPSGTPTLMSQLDRKKVSWRGYAEDMSPACQHPEVGQQDHTQAATAASQYATRHNPFVYFHDVIDRPKYCKRHVVPLTRLAKNLKRVGTTRRFTYIVPDLCSDGHDAPCVDGRPGGTASIDQFMKAYVPLILRSKAFKKDGMLVITADESDSAAVDSTACCGEGFPPPPNTPLAGISGPGGGLIGTLVISRWTTPNTTSATPYNHYSLLASLEDLFRVPTIGYAQPRDLVHFGTDVYSRP